MRFSKLLVVVVSMFGVLIGFQNCSQKVSFDAAETLVASNDVDTIADTDVDTELDNCLVNPLDCESEKPYVSKAGVVTILLALGDQFDSLLIINQESSRLIAEDMVKYASPVQNPKILVVRDHRHHNESVEDFAFISEYLLENYDVDTLEEPLAGLSIDMFEGYDVVWFNNPGHPMSNLSTRDALIDFSGGVILSGDDLSRGIGFSMEPLTGLSYINNGTSNNCQGESYGFDNNSNLQYSVNLSSSVFPGVSNDILSFNYGNDIDMSSVSGLVGVTEKVEVLATAAAAYGNCSNERPTVIRYEK